MSSRDLSWRGLMVLAAVLVLGVAGLSACAGGDPGVATSSAATPKPGGTYSFPVSADPVSIEPLNAQDAPGMQVAHQVFQGLTKWSLDDGGELVTVPSIAEKWESTDAQTWVFHLKPGVTFQAPVSRAVTAQDFVDSWSRVTDPKNGSYVAYILAPLLGCDDRGYQTDPAQGLTGVKALDASTLEVTLRYPFADFPAALGHPVAAVTPVDYIEQLGAKAYAKRPVGTGPYAVQSWRRGRALRLVKNQSYWDKKNAGWVDTIEMPIFQDAEVMWSQFEKGLLDCSQVPPGQVAAVTSHPSVVAGDWTARSWPALAVYFIAMNMADATLGQDLELRKAISESADAQGVIDGVSEGVPLPAGGYVPEGTPGYKPAQNPYSYSLEGASAIVSGMGGAPTLQYWYDTDEGHRQVAEVLGTGWQKAGIEVKLSDYEWATFLDKLSQGNKGSGSQLFRMGWIADYPSMDNVLYPLFQSDQSRTGSYTSYSNQGVDDLLRQARATLDTQQRYNLYAQAEKIILTDMPAVPLYYYRYFRVANERIGGFAVDPMGLTDMWTVWVK